ncbi:MAG: HAD-IIB family hydrolase [Polyangiales bacterium]
MDRALRPLAELPVPAGLVGLAFDVDDTITEGGKLMPCALESMQALRRAHVRLIAVTGRPLGWAEVLARVLPVDIAIGENGAGWFYSRDGRAAEGYILRAEERTALEDVHARIRHRVSKELPSIREASDARLRRYDLAFDIAEEERVDESTRRALAAVIRQEGCEPVTSSVHCHAATGRWDKAVGIEAAALDVFGAFESDAWVFVGDSGNDAPAFEFFRLSVGVSNVRDHNLRSEPRFVTPSPRGKGFSELCAHIIESRTVE